MILKRRNNQQSPSNKIEQSCINSGKIYNAMKDKKKLEVLLKVIRRLYDKIPGVQEMTDALMTEIYAEEDVSPEQIFFILLLSLS